MLTPTQRSRVYRKAAENDLVLIRTETRFGYSNTWWRVMFIDNDDSFIGKLERCHWCEYEAHKIGDTAKWSMDQVTEIYQEGQQFCYSDQITICDCEGLCKEK